MTTFLAAGNNPLAHVLDKPVVDDGTGWPLQIGTFMLVLGGVVTVLVLSLASGSIATGPESMGARRFVPRSRLGQLVDAVVGFILGMLEGVMGKDQTRRWAPFLLTLFCFVLSLNLFGLIPLGDLKDLIIGSTSGKGAKEASMPIWTTATANIFVNLGLATVVFFAIQFQAFRELGVKGWFEHLAGGKDIVSGPKGLWPVIPIIFVVELLGLIIKPTALAIRLFANMVGGHTLMATLYMFGAMAPILALKIAVASVAGLFAVVITFLELFVAFLQAFVFMFLSAVFISTMSHHGDHDHEHDHEHGHDPAHGHGHDAHAPAH
jgi:F-type H+-transporting ATPase subunit a